MFFGMQQIGENFCEEVRANRTRLTCQLNGLLEYTKSTRMIKPELQSSCARHRNTQSRGSAPRAAPQTAVKNPARRRAGIQSQLQAQLRRRHLAPARAASIGGP